MKHELKILPEYFNQVRSGMKTAEVRIDDRNFMPGELLILKEWRPKKKVFTGREVVREITHMTQLSDFIIGIDHRWVMLSMKEPAND